MLWRILSAVVVLFWAVMTGLIIRDTYFPDHSRFAVVPPKFVFDLFLTEAAAFNNTLHLYHEKEKIGHTTFTIRRDGNVEEDEEAPVYAVLASGSMDLKESQIAGHDVTYRLTGELEDAERWSSFDLELKSVSADMQATVIWKTGDKLPAIEVKKAGQLVMNTQFIQTMMAMKGAFGGETDWLAQLTKVREGAQAMPLKAREGIMELAGKQRRCYIVTLDVLQMEEVRLYFTEVGELARIEFPQGYRFIEPMMHGLERGMNTLE
ncbi:hypothetical protein EI77_04407 [Prosthecobacter fusiformis]|uniref:Uncharacterized protein n=2 Tax=Prosthecobacter fusiformis TaxID=48464 RepID=A0A4R7RJ14_9BACT|nr:hypothetical protein EI77_04407 [Prosthecobacter fusiformis]